MVVGDVPVRGPEEELNVRVCVSSLMVFCLRIREICIASTFYFPTQNMINSAAFSHVE